MHEYIHTCIQIYTCVCTHVYIYTRVFAHMYTYRRASTVFSACGDWLVVFANIMFVFFFNYDIATYVIACTRTKNIYAHVYEQICKLFIYVDIDIYEHIIEYIDIHTYIYRRQLNGTDSCSLLTYSLHLFIFCPVPSIWSLTAAV